MLRVTVHAGRPSQATRFNRQDWIDIGYQKLGVEATYKVVLWEQGIGARQPVYLESYPRWSSSLWDLVARAIALALWTAPPALDARAEEPPSAVDEKGEPIQIDDVTPIPPRRPPPATKAGKVQVRPPDFVGSRCAFATLTTALITHFPSTGVGGRRLGTMVIAQHRTKRGFYGVSVDEDAHLRKIDTPIVFMPRFLSPIELVLRASLSLLTGGHLDRLPDCPSVHVPRTEIIKGVTYVPIHRLDEPAKTGFQRWLLATGQMPKPARGASLGRVPAELYTEFLRTAV